MTNTNNEKKPNQIEKEEKLEKVISISSDEIYYIDRDMKTANNTEDLKLQRGITVFTTIANIIERTAEEERNSVKKDGKNEMEIEREGEYLKEKFSKKAFEMLQGSILNTVKNGKIEAKENLLNYFKKDNYKNIILTIGGEKKTLSEFVEENYESMCYFFENTYGKNIPSADSLKKLNNYRTMDLYFTNGLAEDVLEAVHKASDEEEFCKNMTKKYKEVQKEIEENKKLTKDNTKTGVKCALGFGAAGLAVAFPPLILISAIVLLLDTKKDLPFASVVGEAVGIAKKALNEIDQTITGQVNKFRSEKEKEKKEEFDKIIKDNSENSKKIRETMGKIGADGIKNMNITEEDFKTIKAVSGITRHEIYKVMDSKKITKSENLEQTGKSFSALC